MQLLLHYIFNRFNSLLYNCYLIICHFLTNISVLLSQSVTAIITLIPVILTWPCIRPRVTWAAACVMTANTTPWVTSVSSASLSSSSIRRKTSVTPTSASVCVPSNFLSCHFLWAFLPFRRPLLLYLSGLVCDVSLVLLFSLFISARADLGAETPGLWSSLLPQGEAPLFLKPHASRVSHSSFVVVTEVFQFELFDHKAEMWFLSFTSNCDNRLQCNTIH